MEENEVTASATPADRIYAPPSLHDTNETDNFFSVRSAGDVFLLELSAEIEKELLNSSQHPQFNQEPTNKCHHEILEYSYQALNNGNNIRLFHLEPGILGDPIRGSLVHVALSSKPDYDALSYTWGKSARVHKVYTPHGIITATASLYSALARLRDLHRIRVLWIDSLCINQADTAEKNHQVLLMAKIYRSALTVPVYLGEPFSRADLAINMIRKVAETDFHRFEAQLADLTFLPILLLDHSVDDCWNAFQEFWRRSWFRRVWVIQEFVFARDVKFLYGEYELDWKVLKVATYQTNEWGLAFRSRQPGRDVFRFLQASSGVTAMMNMCELRCQSDTVLWLEDTLLEPTVLQSFDERTRYAIRDSIIPATNLAITSICMNPELSSQYASLLDLDDIYRSGQSCGSVPTPRVYQGQSLMKLLDITQMSEATDPKDRLFALLCLAGDLNDDERNLLAPQYDEPIGHIACKFASVLVQKGHCVEILGRAGHQTHPMDWPSWIPLWPITKRSLLGMLSLSSLGQGIYKAGGICAPKARIAQSLDVLVLTGCLFDIVEDISSCVTHSTGCIINEIDRIFDRMGDYPTGESLIEVRWRTLIGNLGESSGREAPKEYHSQYKMWRNYTETLRGTLSEFPPSAQAYRNAVDMVGCNKIGRTQKGYVGLIPLHTRAGDQVCIIPGGVTPYIVRESKDRQGFFRFIGSSYIHGLMGAEALKSHSWEEHDVFLH